VEWYKFDDSDPMKRDMIDWLCEGLPNPKKARDFLTCPRLSQEKLNRLREGSTKPTDNAYEKHVARLKKNDTEFNKLSVAEGGGPKELFTYRLMTLRSVSRNRALLLSKYREPSTLLQLDRMIEDRETLKLWGPLGLAPITCNLEPVWDWLRHILPVSNRDIEKDLPPKDKPDPDFLWTKGMTAQKMFEFRNTYPHFMKLFNDPVTDPRETQRHRLEFRGLAEFVDRMFPVKNVEDTKG
jgi:hypothetical protein